MQDFMHVLCHAYFFGSAVAQKDCDKSERQRDARETGAKNLHKTRYSGGKPGLITQSRGVGWVLPGQARRQLPVLRRSPVLRRLQVPRRQWALRRLLAQRRSWALRG